MLTCPPVLRPVFAGKFQFSGLGRQAGRTMKRSKFTEAQIAFILRQGDEGTPIGEVCRKAGISEATYYNWRKKHGGLMPSEIKRLRQLEEKNGKLKKIVADLSFDKRRCSRTSSAESSEACLEASTGRSRANDLAGERSTCLPPAASRTFDPPLPLPSSRAGSADRPHQGDCSHPGALWVPSHPCSAAP